MNIKRSILVRVRVAFLCVMVFAVCVAAKIGHIQFVDGDKWEKMSEEINFDYKKVKVSKKVLFIVGNEVDGIEKRILKLCDVVAEVPMNGKKESLNVSVAFGVALFRILNI